MLHLPGHLGSAVSALVDGELDEVRAARGWRHVEGCAACRLLVERESWLKRRLSRPEEIAPDAALTGALVALPRIAGPSHDPVPIALPGVSPAERRRTGARRMAVAAFGFGTVSVALAGVGGLALGETGGGTGGSGQPGPRTAVPSPVMSSPVSSSISSPVSAVKQDPGGVVVDLWAEQRPLSPRAPHPEPLVPAATMVR